MIQAFTQHLLGDTEQQIYAYFQNSVMPWLWLAFGIGGIFAIVVQTHRWFHDVENRPKHQKHLIWTVVGLALLYSGFALIVYGIVGPLINKS